MLKRTMLDDVGAAMMGANSVAQIGAANMLWGGDLVFGCAPGPDRQ